MFGAVGQAFGQLGQILSRLEDEAQREHEALRLRIDEETSELKATMTFSRASVVASVEQEVGLSGAVLSLTQASVSWRFGTILNFSSLVSRMHLNNGLFQPHQLNFRNPWPHLTPPLFHPFFSTHLSGKSARRVKPRRFEYGFNKK